MSEPKLQMYRSDEPTEEIGISSNPIDFGFCKAGETTNLPYDILLWNDKGGVQNSEDATNLQVELLRFSLIEHRTGNGEPSQEFIMSYIPVVDEIAVKVNVDGAEWLEVRDFTGAEPTDKIFTFDYTAGKLVFGDGINGEIPSSDSDIEIIYVPDLNIFGKLIYSDKWIGIKSNGVIQNEISVELEQSTKVDNDTIQLLHYPQVTSVVGVWDNPEKSGINYYTNGSFDANLGTITLGTPFTSDIPYTEYTYQIKDEGEGAYTLLGAGIQKSFSYRLPRNNAKKLQLQIKVPATADPEGGAYIRCELKITYES